MQECKNAKNRQKCENQQFVSENAKMKGKVTDTANQSYKYIVYIYSFVRTSPASERRNP